MSGGGSRNPTPPIGRPTSTPTPPQLPSQVPEHSPVVYGTVESAHLAASAPVTAASDQKQEEKPKPDPVLMSPSPVLRLALSGEKKERGGPTSETAVVESLPELPLPPSPTTVSPLGRSTTASPSSATLSSQPIFTTATDDKCELSSSTEDTIPTPNPTSCTEASDPSPTDEIDDDICKTSCSIAPSDLPLISSTNLINEMNGVSEKLPATESIVEIVKQEVLPLTLELEILENPPEEVKVEYVPTPITPSAVPSFSPSPPTPPASPPPTPVIGPAAATNVSTASVPSAVQRVLEEDESGRTCLSEDAKEIQNKAEVEADGQTEEIVDSQNLGSRKSPVPAQAAITAPKMWKKPKDRTRTTEEVFEAALEPKAEEELSSDKVLESEQDKMSQGFHPERDPSDLKNVKAVEENGEEAEPVRNGAESVSEGEGVDANSGSTDSSGEGVTFPFKSGKFIPAFLCMSFLSRLHSIAT